ncbi:MAG: carboxylating nicotinate-nucleotide diphosphorylase [Bacillota bacterium]
MNIRLVEEIVRRALDEDIGTGDITTEATVPAQLRAKAQMIVKSEGVIAGLPVVETVFRLIDSQVSVTRLVAEGSKVAAGTAAAQIEGPARAIVTGERVALNFLQRLSGIATMANQATEQLRFYPTRVVGTRKTTPGLRVLEKYAIRVGGAGNHRYGLYDAVLIKDNHIRLAGGIKEAVVAARKLAPFTMKIEVETENLDQVKQALEAGADVIMLDNMEPEEMKKAVALIGNKALTEASGTITLDKLAEVAKTGVNFISMGALTHSARALDISLEVVEKAEYR